MVAGKQTAGRQVTWEMADQVYAKTLTVARFVFATDIQVNAALKLAGSRKTSLDGWVDQATTFYGHLLARPHLAAALGRFGYTSEKLAAEKALVEAVGPRGPGVRTIVPGGPAGSC